MSELETQDTLPDPFTGELLPAIPVNAAHIHLEAARYINELRSIQRECVRILAEESQRQGIKTLHLDGGHDVKLIGGMSTDYDPHELMAGLMEVGCPPERINAAVKEIVEYKLDRRVVRQLAAANPNYAEAIERASKEVENPWRATISKRVVR